MCQNKIIVISFDCAGGENSIVAGGIATHVYEIYSHLDANFKDKILLLTGYGYDHPLNVSTIKLPYLNIRYLKLFSFHFIAALYLLFFLRKLKPKAVHIQFLESSFFPALAASLMGAKIIISSHFYYKKTDFDFLLRPIVDLMWKIVLPLIDTLIVLSPDARDYYYNMFKEHDLHNKININVVPNGAISLLFLEQLNEEKSLQKNNDSRIILFVGRLGKPKNVIKLLEAFDKISEKDLELWLVGDGPDKTKVENYIRTSKKYNKIKVLGWQPRKQVYRLMKSADIFILPSLWEGMPIALFEAYALGMKCVCHRNTFTEKIPGVILLNSPESDEILDKIQKALITDCHNDQQFIKQYSWENSSNSLKRIYERYI